MDRAESRGVEHEKGTVGCREQNVVRVFVLDDHVRRPEGRLLNDRPAKNALQRRQGSCCVTQKKRLTHVPKNTTQAGPLTGRTNLRLTLQKNYKSFHLLLLSFFKALH